jgi:Chaperone of endosialidase
MGDGRERGSDGGLPQPEHILDNKQNEAVRRFARYTSPTMLALLVGDRMASASPAPSDARLKRDIARVERLPNGLNLYRYRYRWSDTCYVGVMAQEVASVDPDAVVCGADGYLRVNYGRLGLRLQTWDEWAAT